jgi:long-chain-fatty-acid--CoA ligase ACSBG
MIETVYALLTSYLCTPHNYPDEIITESILLCCLQTEVDKETSMPIEKLSPVAIDWCRSIGSNVKTLTEIRDGRDEKVLRAIQAGIDRANQSAISRAQIIQKWSILPRDFSINGGELGTYNCLNMHVV